MYLLSICINNNSFQYTTSCGIKESTGFSLTGKLNQLFEPIKTYRFHQTQPSIYNPTELTIDTEIKGELEGIWSPTKLALAAFLFKECRL